MVHIAENIKRIRKIKNLSQKEVAAGIGVAQAQYSVIEGGTTVPTIPTLEKIALVLEVGLTEFFKDPKLAAEEVNLSILEKVKLIDMALAKKKLKDNLSQLVAG